MVSGHSPVSVGSHCVIRRDLRSWVALLLVVAVPGAGSLCAPVAGAPGVAGGAATDSRGASRLAPGSLAGSFTGMLPCADCAGIRCQIDLLPGGVYAQRTTWLRGDHDETTYQLGRWSLSSDGRTVMLTGGRAGTEYWSARSPRTLRKLDAAGNPMDSRLAGQLTRAPHTAPVEPRVRLVGTVRPAGSARRFHDCRSGLEWPLAGGAGQPALERAIAARRRPAGPDLLVSLEGRVERDDGGRSVLVVEKFLRAMPDQTCESRAPAARLEGTRWRPVRIGERAVTVTSRDREPWLQLDAGTGRITGSGGCNRIAGRYETGRGTLRFREVISTRMLCPSMSTEVGFLRALEGTRRHRLLDRILELLDERGTLLARLEAGETK